MLAQLDDTHEEAFEQRQTEPLADAGQAGVVRQGLIQVIAQIPAMGEVESDRTHQLPLGSHSLKEEDELELEEHHRVDTGPTTRGIAVLHPGADQRQVQRGVEVAIEMVCRDQLLQRDGHGLIQQAQIGRAEHANAPGQEVPWSLAPHPASCPWAVFQHAGSFVRRN